MLDRETAVRRLTNRWLEQCELFPLMREDIPLKRWIAVNIAFCRRHELLKEYDRA